MLKAASTLLGGYLGKLTLSNHVTDDEVTCSAMLHPEHPQTLTAKTIRKKFNVNRLIYEPSLCSSPLVVFRKAGLLLCYLQDADVLKLTDPVCKLAVQYPDKRTGLTCSAP